MSDIDRPDEDSKGLVSGDEVREFVKARETEFQAGTDAVDHLSDIAGHVSLNIWIQAEDYAEKDQRTRVMEKDVRDAYRDIFDTHNMLYEATADLEKLKSRFERHIEKSPMSNQDGDP